MQAIQIGYPCHESVESFCAPHDNNSILGENRITRSKSLRKDDDSATGADAVAKAVVAKVVVERLFVRIQGWQVA